MNKISVKFMLLTISLLVMHSSAVASISAGVTFSQGEIDIIVGWYSDQGVASVRGKGPKKQKGLPPGIAKNLARGKALPPGIAKQVLPQGLIEILPPPPHGFERVIVDGKVLLIEVTTRIIRDILTDIILH